jgi:fructose-bisphosphate aldolase class II
MPLATPAQLVGMLDAARAGGFAYPAVNVTSSQTLNAALRGFAEAGSHGIVQLTTGGAAYAAGPGGDMAAGARAVAEYARAVAEGVPVLVALHTDHCPPGALDAFVRPLLAEARALRGRGEEPRFASHMFDGSALPLEENLGIAEGLLAECRALGLVLEVECGVVGGQEDGIGGGGWADRYTTPADLLRVADRLGTGERGRYLLAATFGNVHGRTERGAVRLEPAILAEGQRALAASRGPGARFDFVFHGGSGSDPADVRAAVANGVVKMNIDSDAQHAFTRAAAAHVMRSDDPRTWGRPAEQAMAHAVAAACRLLGSAGTALPRRSGDQREAGLHGRAGAGGARDGECPTDGRDAVLEPAEPGPA